MDTTGRREFQHNLHPYIPHSRPGSEVSEEQDGELPAAEPRSRMSTIREMVKDFGVSIRTLRFYEDRGLLRPRREGTVRRYDARSKLHLRMILTGKQLGFSLSEIEGILASKGDETGEMDPERDLLPEQIDAQISYLERQRARIDEAISALQDAHRRASRSNPPRSALCQSIRALERVLKKLREMF